MSSRSTAPTPIAAGAALGSRCGAGVSRRGLGEAKVIGSEFALIYLAVGCR